MSLSALRFWKTCIGRLALVGAVLAVAFAAPPAEAAATLEKFLQKLAPADLIAGADGFAAPQGAPPIARILKGGETIGHALLTSDFVDTTGYSGKPIHTIVALDTEGRIAGAKLVKHSEPIVLIGIPEKRIVDFIARYNGLSVTDIINRRDESRAVDMVSGATVTVLVIEDNIFRTAVMAARRLGLAGLKPLKTEAKVQKRLDLDVRGRRDWQTLLREGSVKRWQLTIGEVNSAFERSGNAEAAARAEVGPADEPFIDLNIALVSVPAIGESVLGPDEYRLLADRLSPGQQAIAVFANGRYSFKGSGYVRGGLFERFHLIQGENSFRFRDRDHKRLGDVLAEGAPHFKEVGLFTLAPDADFDPAEPWRLKLLVQRAIGPVKKVFHAFETDYRLPDNYIIVETPHRAPSAAEPAAAADATVGEDGEPPLWQRIWKNRVVDIGILATAIVFLTGLFFFQNMLVVHRRLTDGIRIGFLLFTTVWLGYVAQAQLSVVNVFTFSNAFVERFRWEYFLMEPLIFMLWCAVIASLLFWGRGAYCGWLCPFGALQELTNKLARLARVPQIRIPWGIHERLWPIKYIIFMGLFGLSFYSLALAEHLAEVEPFKTAIVLKFAREWPFTLYAATLLIIGLFIERFFCRYLCPLGAALAIPGRLRMFDWLKRYKECGSPCQRCADSCMVQAIHPEGHINPNECLYCLNCQTLYFDDHRCPVMIERRQRRERRERLSTPSPQQS